MSAAELKSKKDSTDLRALVDLTKTWYTACKNARIFEERQWFKNIDMYQGRQFTVWNDQKKKMIDVPPLDYNVRLSVNIIEPIARVEMTKTGKNMPIPTVSPASNDLNDLMAAEAAEAAVDWWYRQQKFQTTVFVPANWWRTMCGVSFIKTYWDASCHDIAADDAARLIAEKQQADMEAGLAGNVSPMPGAAFGPAAVVPPKPILGAVVGEHVSPFHLYIPDPSELDLQKQPYVIQVYTKTVEEAKLAYKDRLPDDWAPAPITSNAIVDLSRLGIMGTTLSKPDSVLIMETWVKPGYTDKLPNGGLIITCADDIVHFAPNGIPYSHGEYPYAMLTGIENGKFYRKSTVESITPLQNELNQTLSQIVKRKNLMSAPQFFYQEGAVDPRRITNKPGQYIPVRLGQSNPTPVPISEVPQYILQLLDRIRGYLDDLSGQHQVSRATSPGANTPASALALLQEADDDFLFTTFGSIDSAMETVGRHILSLMVQFWDEPRLVKITGRETAFDVKQLMGSDLKNGTDLRVESGSALPQSKTARIATITDWIEKGIITAEVGLQAMEMGTLGRLYRKIRIDFDQAQRENIEMRDLDVATVQAQLAARAMAQEQVQNFQAQLQQTVPQPIDLPGGPQQAQPMQPMQPGQPAPGDPAAAGAPISQQPQPPQATPAAPAQPQAPAPQPIYPIGWMDNDAAHMQQHADFAKGETFKKLDPAIQQVFQEHYYAHMARANQLALVGAQIQGEQTGARMQAQGLTPGLYQNTQRESIKS